MKKCCNHTNVGLSEVKWHNANFLKVGTTLHLHHSSLWKEGFIGTLLSERDGEDREGEKGKQEEGEQEE